MGELNKREMAVLSCLMFHGRAQTAKQISNLLSMDLSDTYKSFKNLEKMKLITKIEDKPLTVVPNIEDEEIKNGN